VVTKRQTIRADIGSWRLGEAETSKGNFRSASSVADRCQIRVVLVQRIGALSGVDGLFRRREGSRNLSRPGDPPVREDRLD